jgi:hypothetical protein
MRTQAGVYQIMKFYPELLNPWRNRMFGHWISYKLMRLLLPWFFMGMLLSSLFFPAPWNWVLAGGQALFYLMAALDFVAPANLPGRHILTAARTFVAMLLAAAGAVSVFFVSPQRLWSVTKAQPRQRTAA